jgi:hypothetical protein
MHQVTQLAGDRHRQQLAHAEAQRPAERVLALARAPRRAGIRRPALRPGRAGRCLKPATARPAKTPAGLLLTGLGRQRDQRPEGRGERL